MPVSSKHNTPYMSAMDLKKDETRLEFLLLQLVLSMIRMMRIMIQIRIKSVWYHRSGKSRFTSLSIFHVTSLVEPLMQIFDSRCRNPEYVFGPSSFFAVKEKKRVKKKPTGGREKVVVTVVSVERVDREWWMRRAGRQTRGKRRKRRSIIINERTNERTNELFSSSSTPHAQTEPVPRQSHIVVRRKKACKTW